jgi:hypothetical protein
MIIQDLKDAVSNRDWNLVAKVIEELDGSVLEISDGPDPNEAILKELDAIRERVLKGTTTTITSKAPKKRNKRGNRPNLFEEMISTLPIEKEPGEEFLDDTVARKRETRAPFEEVPVLCTDCNKTVMVNPMFKRDFYKCDLHRLGKCPNGPK